MALYIMRAHAVMASRRAVGSSSAHLRADMCAGMSACVRADMCARRLCARGPDRWRAPFRGSSSL